MIAGEHRALPDQGKAEMVGRMTGRVQHVESNAAGLDLVSVLQRPVGPEGGIDEGFAEAGRTGAALGARRPKAQDLAADEGLQRPRAITMVAMT